MKKGSHHSDETRRKMSEHSGWKTHPETMGMTGKRRSKADRQNLSQKALQQWRNVDPDTKLKWLTNGAFKSRREANRQPNPLELKFIDFMTKQSLPFKYVGTKKSRSNSIICNEDMRFPDFIHFDRDVKIVIEIGNKFRHPPQQVAFMKRQYTSADYVCLFFWDFDFYKRLEWVKSEILKELENYRRLHPEIMCLV